MQGVPGRRKLLSPIPAQDRLTLLPGNHVNEGGWIPVSRGWWQEATVAALRDAASSPVPARRVLFVFSGLDDSGTKPGRGAGSWPAIGNEAIRLGIAIDPVVMDFYKWAASQHITGDNPHIGLFSVPVTMRDGSTRYVGAPRSGRLGEMTGGEMLLPDHLTRDTLANILQLIRNKTLSKYLVGFVPEAAAQPGKHKLQVVLESKTAGKIVGGRETRCCLLEPCPNGAGFPAGWTRWKASPQPHRLPHQTTVLRHPVSRPCLTGTTTVAPCI